MSTSIRGFLRNTVRISRAATRRRREDRVALGAPPAQRYTSGYMNESGSWCGIEKSPRRGAPFVWVPWDPTGQIRR